MGSRDKTTLTEEHVRRLTDEQSFQRGRKYYADGAVRNQVRQGPEIRAECYGSRHEPYRVKAVLGENGVQAASCTCPRGGFCKHIVALLLAYIHEPEAFREVPALEAMLAALTRDDLVAACPPCRRSSARRACESKAEPAAPAAGGASGFRPRGTGAGARRSPRGGRLAIAGSRPSRSAGSAGPRGCS